MQKTASCNDDAQTDNVEMMTMRSDVLGARSKTGKRVQKTRRARTNGSRKRRQNIMQRVCQRVQNDDAQRCDPPAESSECV